MATYPSLAKFSKKESRIRRTTHLVRTTSFIAISWCSQSNGAMRRRMVELALRCRQNYKTTSALVVSRIVHTLLTRHSIRSAMNCWASLRETMRCNTCNSRCEEWKAPRQETLISRITRVNSRMLNWWSIHSHQVPNVIHPTCTTSSPTIWVIKNSSKALV